MWFWFFWISLFINFLLVFYVRWLLKTIEAINADIENITISISQFSSHIQSLYELEMFYGDQTLQSLLEHSKQLVAQLQDIDLILNTEGEVESAEEAPEEN